MATPTTNFALTKPAPSDLALIGDINDNMDDVDRELARFGFKSTDIASAATLTLPAQGSVFDITGTTTVTAISTRTAGEVVVLQFDDVLTLTHNAATLKLVGGANLTTIAGDLLTFVSEGGGGWRQLAPVGRTPSTQAMGDAAAAGTSSVPALADHKHAMPAGFVLAGSDTTERTTTSTSTVSLSTVTVSIPATTPFLVIGAWRKTTGALATAALGLMLNATTVKSPGNVSINANQVDSGFFMAWIGLHSATYLGTGLWVQSALAGAAAQLSPLSAGLPDATITSVIIRGSITDALVTLAIDDVRVYTLPTN